MKVLLTGSTGFVGLNILNALIEQGHEVHCYVRATANREHINKFNIATFEGELSDLVSLKAAMQDVDAVIHTAGNTSCFMRDYNDLYDVNVKGTKNIVDVALACDIKHLIYTSTTSTIGGSSGKGEVEDEQSALLGFRAKSPYGITKTLAEKEMLRAHSAGIRTIILNPAEIVGAYDHNFQWGRLVMAVYANQVPFLPPGGGSFCSAQDVANAHVTALTRGRSGERYILAGDDRDYISMLKIISEKLDQGFDMPTSNYFLLYLKERSKEIFYPLLGKTHMVEPYRMKVFSGFYFYSIKKAQDELGYSSGSLEEMLGQCIGWYRQNGVL